MFVITFLTLFVNRENGESHRHDTFIRDWQRRWDHAIKFVRWQHHTMGCEVFDVHGTSCYITFVLARQRVG